ncbi:GGDEF domain-containing protein [Halarcobacter sp.]|uniref:GGDEF domain-containing protein n=1 Tax=Halarcobacter sp. TaxID=2321133 RepID=UPI002AA7F92E|nr:GGDEF domain-containing protein [Halarcobacter sp.]
MKQIIKTITEIGITDDTDHWLSGKIKLVNIISLVNFIFILSMIFLDLLLNKTYNLSIILLIISFIMFIPYYLNYKKKYIASRIAFLSLAYISICSLAVLFGKEFNFQYYLVPGVGMSLIFFRDEIGNKKWIFTFLGIPLWIFLEIWFVLYSPIISVGKYIEVIPYFSTLLIFLTAILMFGTFTHESGKHLKNISNMNKKLKKLANIDPLTKLYNRRFMDEKINYFFNLSKRNNGFLAMCIFDIDFFKKVNDTYGHDAGDKVLQTVSKLAKENFRETDFVGRIGGEEFCVIFTYGNINSVKDAIERFRKIIENNRLKYEKNEIKTTASFGISYLTSDIKTQEQLYKNADSALYEAKNTGRNKIVDAI